MKKMILGLILMSSFSANADDCRITAKKYLDVGPLRSHNPMGSVSLKVCLQKATQVMQGKDGFGTGIQFDDLMVQHIDKNGKANVVKMKKSSAKEYEKYYLFD